ncbi:MAG TPA: copper-binding protein [Bryobacteraceae bacterium]|nr:copper-binding protein [Bryobacteraceae bacterium]
MKKQIGLLALALSLAACGAKQQAKQYAMQGEIRDLDPSTKSATINAGKIGDWMEAMTMEYPIKPDADFQKLHVGDHIQATVVVNNLKYYVTNITVVPK